MLVATWGLPASAEDASGLSNRDNKAEENPSPELPKGLNGGAEEKKQQGPSLPAGLDEKGKSEDGPGLPEGLGSSDQLDEKEPDLPTGLGQKEEPDGEGRKVQPVIERLPFDLSGFLEARVGTRLQPDSHEQTTTLGEARLQLDMEKYLGSTRLKLVSDFIYDPIGDDYGVHLESGRGWLDLRQANVSFTPVRFADVRVGRQILTWGTGNFLFLNDLFPKDWKAFFIGRDIEYLKAPSDAVKVSTYSDLVNMDLVYVPSFDSDRFVDGRRLSYWNSRLRRRAGDDAIVDPRRRNQWFTDDEWAGRLHRTFGSYEVAAYGYYGYWKSPSGFDPGANAAIYPRLSAYGGSARGPVWGGIGNVEFSYYDSRDDRSGTDPNIPNSELRFLVGYEREVARNLTMGWQYYLEYMMQYDEYQDNLPAGSHSRDEDRHVITFDVTQLLWNQNLELSMFSFYSPSDNDMYLRPKVEYQVDDNWSVEVGGNIFAGEHRYTFFNQFRDNTNVFAAVRFGF